MGQDQVESLSLCKAKDTTYLVTITSNESEGRAIWIDDYELLIGDYEGHMIPIVDKNSFKTKKQIENWLKPHFGKVSCSPISYEDVQMEMDRQADEYQKLYK